MYASFTNVLPDEKNALVCEIQPKKMQIRSGEDELFQEEYLYLTLVSHFGCNVSLNIKFAKQYEELKDDVIIDCSLPKIDFDMYARKFRCTFMSKNNLKLNWEQA